MSTKNFKEGRRKYDSAFKEEVLKMVFNGRPVNEVAQSLGIGENLIYRWKKQVVDTSTAPLSNSTSAQVSLAEHLELQKRLRELEMERDI